MSERNVEIVRRLVPVKERRPDEYVPYLHPEVEIIPAPDFPDSEIFRGHAGFERWKTRWPSTFERHDIEPTRSVTPTTRWWLNSTSGLCGLEGAFPSSADSLTSGRYATVR